MNISQVLTKLKALIYSKSETDSLLGGKANSSHTHTKSQITDFPTIPTKTSQLTNDSGFLTSHQSLSNYSTLANTVKSLSISGKTITVTPGSGNAYTLTTQDTNTTYSNFVKSGSGAAAGLVPAPSTTAGTTKYLREDGTWQVPPDHTYTVNNATLTIQKNGSNVATFTSNASSNVTANISVPTKVSQLTNDSGFITGISWANVSGKPSTFAPSSHIHTTMEGTYSGNGGKQGPSYYGKNRVGFLMSNESVNGDSDYKNWLYMDNYGADDVGGATAIGVDRMHAKAFIMQSAAARSAWNESAELLSSRHLGTAMGTASFVIHRNGITSPGWQGNGTGSSVLQIRTTDNTEPSICFHRSGHSHCVLGEQSGELITHQQDGTKYRINHDGKTTLNGYKIYVG